MDNNKIGSGSSRPVENNHKPHNPPGDGKAKQSKTSAVKIQENTPIQTDRNHSRYANHPSFSKRSVRRENANSYLKDLRGLLRGGMLQDIEAALKDNREIIADDRYLERDCHKVKEIVDHLNALNGVSSDKKFRNQLQKHAEQLKKVDPEKPEQLAEVVVGLSNDLRHWHFRADFDQALNTGAQVLKVDRELKDILKYFMVVEPEDGYDSGIESDTESIQGASESGAEDSMVQETMTTRNSESPPIPTHSSLNSLNGESNVQGVQPPVATKTESNRSPQQKSDSLQTQREERATVTVTPEEPGNKLVSDNQAIPISKSESTQTTSKTFNSAYTEIEPGDLPSPEREKHDKSVDSAVETKEPDAEAKGEADNPGSPAQNKLTDTKTATKEHNHKAEEAKRQEPGEVLDQIAAPDDKANGLTQTANRDRTAKADVDAELSTARKRKEELQFELAKMKQQLEAAQLQANRIPNLEQELKKAKNQADTIQDLERQLADEKTLSLQIPGVNAELKNARKAADRIPGLEADLKAAQMQADQVTDLKTQVDALEKLVKSLRLELDQERKEKTGIQTELGTAREHEEAQRLELAEMKLRLEAALEQANRIPTLERELQEAEKLAGTMPDLKRQLDHEKTLSSSQHADLRNKLAKAEEATDRIAGLEAALNTAQAEAAKATGLQEQVATLEGQVNSLQLELTSERKAKAGIETELSIAQEREISQRLELAETKQQLDLSRAQANRIPELERELQEARNLAADIPELKQQLENEKALSSSQLTNLRNKLADAEEATTRVASLEADLKTVQAEADKIAGLQERLVTQEGQVKSMQLELTRERTAKTGIEAELSSAREREEAQRLELTEMKQRLDSAQEQANRIPDLESELQETRKLADTIQNLEHQLADKNTLSLQLPGLKAELEKARKAAGRIAVLEEDLETAQREAGQISGLKDQIATLDGQVKSLQLELDREQKEKTGIQAELSTAREREQSQQLELAETKQQLNAAQAQTNRIPGLEAELQEMRILANTIPDLKQQLENEKTLSSSQLTDLRNKLAKAEEATDRIAVLKEDLNTAQLEAGKAAGLREQVATQEEQIKSLQLELAREQSAKTGIQTELSSAREREETQRLELTEAMQQLAAARSQADRIPDLESELQEARQLAGTIPDLQQQLENEKTLSSSQVTKLQNQLAKAEEATDRIVGLEADLKTAQKEVGKAADLHDQVATLEVQVKNLQLELAREQAAKTGIQTELGTAQEREEAQRIEIKETKQRLESALEQAKRIPELESELNEAKSLADTIQDLEHQLADKNTLSLQIPELKAELEKAREAGGRIAGLEADLKAAQTEAGQTPDLKAQVATSGELIKKLRLELDHERQAKTGIQAELGTAREHEETQRIELEKTKQQLEEALKQTNRIPVPESEQQEAKHLADTTPELQQQLEHEKTLSPSQITDRQDQLEKAEKATTLIAGLEADLKTVQTEADKITGLQEQLVTQEDQVKSFKPEGPRKQGEKTDVETELSTIRNLPKSEFELPDSDTSTLSRMLKQPEVNGRGDHISWMNTNREARESAVNKIVLKVDEYNKWKAALENEDRIPDINSDDEPSQTDLRDRIKQEIKSLDADIGKIVYEFNKNYKEDSSENFTPIERKAEEIKQDLARQVEQIDHFNHMIREGVEVKNWLKKIPDLNDGNKTSDTYLKDILTYLSNIFQSDNNNEIQNYLAGKTIKFASEQLVNKCKNEIEGKNRDELQQIYMNYSRKLGQLHPDNIHKRVYQGKFSRKGRVFSSEIVKERERKLDALFNDKRSLTSGLLNGIEDKSRREQAVEMVEDTRIRPMLLSLINSVKQVHEGTENNVVKENIYSALESGLLDIRDQFNLHPMPDMRDVMLACLDDLEKPHSRLAIESSRQHGGTLHAKNDIARYEKLKTRCENLCKNLELIPKKTKSIPDSSFKITQAFQDPKGILDTATLRNSKMHKDGSFEKRSIVGEGKPLNTFFNGVSGANWRKADEGTESIAIDGGRPAGVIFEKNSSDAWHVILGNKYYTIHPRFLYQFPDIRIPFESNWLPVKADDGKTGILVLQKTAEESQYFLYMPDGKGQLKPQPIDAANNKEIIDAEYFRRAAEGPGNPLGNGENSGKIPEDALYEASKLSGGIRWIGEKWRSKNQQLALLYQHTCEEISGWQDLDGLIDTENKSHDLNVRKVQQSQYSQTQRKKQDRQAIGTTLEDASLSPDLQCYETLSVDASFDKLGSSYFDRCAALPGSDALVELGQQNIKKFKEDAFQKISVFKGCEINPKAKAESPGSIQQVELNLDKVLKVNRDRQLRLNQGVDFLTRKLGSALRKSGTSDDLKIYRDDELVDFSINKFKSGELPKGVDPTGFCDDLVQLILVKNERDFSAGMGRRLEGLKNKLNNLRNAHYESLVMTADEYIGTCQEWNLDMALLAGEQIEANARINHYYNEGLNEQNRVMMSFEQGGLMLRGNQPDMAKRVFDLIDRMDKKDKYAESQNLILQLGTGYGKSKTIIPLAADQAYRKGHSVRIIAPASNQAELDHSLYHYFADQGVDYHRINIFERYVEPALASVTGMPWWSTDNLNEILTSVNKTEPLGISTDDVQLLMTLKEQLKIAQTSPDEVAILEKILDALQYSGLNIFDEYDRSFMPGNPDDLDELTNDMNRALAPLNRPIANKDVARVQSAFLNGSKNKICLSATIGTGFSMAALTKSATVDEAAEKCESDPLTTNARFYHWLTKTVPIISEGTSTDQQRVSIFKTALERSGQDRQIILFDGNDNAETESTRFKGVQQDYANLAKARDGKARGLLYYNDRKALCLYDPQQEKYKESGAAVSAEMERLIRQNPQHYDLRLDRKQGVGSDGPQNNDSIGIHLGFEDPNRRSNVLIQEFGRFSRKSDNFRQQDFYMVIDPSVDAQSASVDISTAAEYQKQLRQYTDSHMQSEIAKKEILNVLGKTSVNELTHQQQRVINTVLHISPPDDLKHPDANLERDLDKFINSWECNDFGEAKEALGKFKRAQWINQNDFLDMMATTMALRENSPFVRDCENNLEQGIIQSEADEILSKAHTWLDTGAKEILNKINLESVQPVKSAAEESEYDHKLFAQELTRVLTNKVQEKLTSIEREPFDQDKPLLEVSRSQYIDNEIANCIKDLSAGRINYKSSKVENKIPSELLTHCQKLKNQADSIFNRISSLCNNGEKIDNSSSNKQVHLIVTKNWSQMIELKAKLDRTFEDLALGNSKEIINFFKTNNNTLQQFYYDLALRISRLEFSPNSNNPDLFRKLCVELTPVMPELRKLSVNDRRLLWRANKKSGGKDFPTGLELVNSSNGKSNKRRSWSIQIPRPDDTTLKALDTIKDNMESDNAISKVKSTLMNNNQQLTPYLKFIRNELLIANSEYKNLLTKSAEITHAKILARQSIKLQ